MVKIYILLFFIISFLVCSSFNSNFSKKNNTFLSPELKKDTISPDSAPSPFKITQTWLLPPALKKISGFDFIDENRIACIQDEVGSIFIYNLTSETIEKEIPFAPPGDYEGLALSGKNAFVACADGRLYEINNYRSDSPEVKEFGTHLTVKQNVEGLCLDRRNKRLLVAIKGGDEINQFYKGIYSFELKSKRMPVKPVISIDLQDTILNKTGSRKYQSLILPSDLDIDPKTGRIFIADATKSQMLIINRSGKNLFLYPLDTLGEIQPEGIRFTPSGELYLASEGVKDEPGKIISVSFRNKN